MSQEEIFWVFFAVWVALGVGSSAFFYLSRNAAVKRRLMPPFMIGAGITFLVFVLLLERDKSWDFLYIVAPMIILITIWNIRIFKFCDACGRTNQGANPFSPPAFCSKCGAKLQ
jgi:hypothetical protein